MNIPRILRILAFTAGMYASGCLVGLGCAHAPSPAQQGAIAEAGCTLLAAFASSPAEQAICATADELIAMEADARSARADAGPGKLGRKSGKCQIVGTACLTDDELAAAIVHRKAAR